MLAVEIVGGGSGARIERGYSSRVHTFHLTGNIIDGSVHVIPCRIVTKGGGIAGNFIF